jgi:hypothetical protein
MVSSRDRWTISINVRYTKIISIKKEVPQIWLNLIYLLLLLLFYFYFYIYFLIFFLIFQQLRFSLFYCLICSQYYCYVSLICSGTVVPIKNILVNNKC